VGLEGGQGEPLAAFLEAAAAFKVAKEGCQNDEGCQVRNARLASTGLKADKTAKTANGTVTFLTGMTLMPLGGRG
jgi:hypothetical protein